MAVWTVRCGCANYLSNIQVVEAATVEDACHIAVRQASLSEEWQPVGHKGATHVDAVAEGKVNGPTGRDPATPRQFTERALFDDTETLKTLRLAQFALGEIVERRIGLLDVDSTTLYRDLTAALERLELTPLVPRYEHVISPRALSAHTGSAPTAG